MFVLGPATLASQRVGLETSMSLTVSWTMYHHGNNPPVTIHIYYKDTRAADWTLYNSHTTWKNDHQMSDVISNLTSSSTYDILIEAINTKTESNMTTYHLRGMTKGLRHKCIMRGLVSSH